MKILFQISLLLLFWLIGEAIHYFTGVPVPGSIMGMLLLVLALEMKWVKPGMIKETADFLLKNMAVFFIPAGVGLMCHFEVIKREWMPVSVAIVVSALLVLASVALIMERKNDE